MPEHKFKLVSCGILKMKQTDDSDDYPEDYFAANKFVLKFGGMWIYDKKKSYCKWFSLLLYNYFCIFVCQIVHTPSETSQLSETYINLNSLIEHSGMLMTHYLGSSKLFSFYWQRKRILQMLKVLEDTEFRYESKGKFRPVVHFQDAKTLASRVTYMFFTAATLVPVSQYISAYYDYFFVHTSAEFLNGHVSCKKILPFFSWIPFRSDTKVTCGLALIYQQIPMIIYAWQIIGHDTLFSSILAYVKAHLLSLQGAFETIRERCLERIGLPEDYRVFRDEENPKLKEQMNLEMKKCSRHLQTIIQVCEEIENIFTFITLGQVLVTLFVLVTCLFMVSSVPLLSGTFAAESVYLGAITYQLGMYAWFGNEITLASNALPSSIYHSNWFSTDYKFKKSMIINMIRMQKPLILTVGKFSPLTLTTLVSIVRGSYSYFAVLKNSNAEE